MTFDPIGSAVKVAFEGQTVDAEEIPVRIDSGGTVVLSLGDGARIELSHNVGKVYRLLGKKKDDGTPIYLIYLVSGAAVSALSSQGGEKPK